MSVSVSVLVRNAAIQALVPLTSNFLRGSAVTVLVIRAIVSGYAQAYTSSGANVAWLCSVMVAESRGSISGRREGPENFRVRVAGRIITRFVYF